MDRIRRDLIASTVSGLVRAGVPALLAVVLYPLLLHAGGLELVGTWGVLQLLVGYLGLSTAGLPSLLIRTLAANDSEAESVSEMVQVALGGYLLTGAALGASLTILAEPLWRMLQLPPVDNVVILLGVTVVAGAVGNIATPYASLLVGVHRLHIAQAFETVSSMVQFVVALLFVLVGHPYVGLALALLTGKATLLVLTALGARREACDHFTMRPRFHLAQFVSLLSRAKGFMFIDAGYTLLQPIVRGLIAVTAGPSELAVFDIGSRLPGVIRNLFVGGLMALFPAIAALSAEGRVSAIRQVMQASMTIVVVLAIAPLSAYLMLAKPILFLWIGDIAPQVLGVSIIMTVWQIVTACNVPFYFSLQALGQEAVVAFNIWLHIALMVPGCLVALWIGFNAAHFAWLLLVTGVISQVQLYVEAQTHGRLLTANFSRWQDYLIIPVSFAFVASAVGLRVDAPNAVAAWREILVAIVLFAALWIVSLAALIYEMKSKNRTRTVS